MSWIALILIQIVQPHLRDKHQVDMVNNNPSVFSVTLQVMNCVFYWVTLKSDPRVEVRQSKMDGMFIIPKSHDTGCGEGKGKC